MRRPATLSARSGPWHGDLGPACSGLAARAERTGVRDHGDRRRSSRQRFGALAALVAVGRHPNDQAFSAVVDVSRHGICVRTGQPPIVGQPVFLRLAIDEEIHTLRTTVTRVAKRQKGVYEVGLDWSSCSARELEFLERCIGAAE